MKKVLLSILIFSMFLVSCTGESEEQIIKRLEKTLSNYTGYETEANVKITMDEKETTYKLKEIYLDENQLNLEILEPKENNGIVIEYKGENIFLNNTTIDQSISLQSIKGNKGVLFGEIFQDRSLIESVKEEELDNINYYMVKYKPKDRNKYNKEKIVYLNRKDFKPYKMITMDEDNNPRVVIEYENFKFNKNEK